MNEALPVASVVDAAQVHVNNTPCAKEQGLWSWRDTDAKGTAKLSHLSCRAEARLRVFLPLPVALPAIVCGCGVRRALLSGGTSHVRRCCCTRTVKARRANTASFHVCGPSLVVCSRSRKLCCTEFRYYVQHHSNRLEQEHGDLEPVASIHFPPPRQAIESPSCHRSMPFLEHTLQCRSSSVPVR